MDDGWFNSILMVYIFIDVSKNGLGGHLQRMWSVTSDQRLVSYSYDLNLSEVVLLAWPCIQFLRHWFLCIVHGLRDFFGCLKLRVMTS